MPISPGKAQAPGFGVHPDGNRYCFGKGYLLDLFPCFLLRFVLLVNSVSEGRKEGRSGKPTKTMNTIEMGKTRNN